MSQVHETPLRRVQNDGRMAETNTTFRLTPEAYNNLQHVSRDAGVSVRAAFEAALLCFLEDGGEEVTAGAWEVARRLHDAHAAGGLERERINLRVDADILGRARIACRNHEVSVNALASAAFTPWGSGWGDEAAYAAREELWRRAVDEARRLDYERRTRRGGSGPELEP